MMKDKISVSQLVDYLKNQNDNDPNLFNIAITGELSNVKVYPSNHMYFDIKDERAKMNGIMFKGAVAQLNFVPKAGDKVTVIGSVKVYQKNGNFQVIANNIILDGYGKLFAQFEENKKLLEAKGLFAIEHKQPISNVPHKIAIISGQDSAALKDVLRTLNMRYKLSQIVVFPTLVQGDLAAQNIINNIKLINRYDFDVILLVRGGGSFEDLNAFNDVGLAHAIFESKIPIVTGIGHESDFTIADFVSDYRGATPTAAAVRVSINSEDFLTYIASQQDKMKMLMNRKVHLLQRQIKNYLHSSYLNNFSLITMNKSQQLDYNYVLLKSLFNQKINGDKKRLLSLKERLETHNIDNRLNEYQQRLVTNQMKLENIRKYKIELVSNRLSQKHERLLRMYRTYLKEQTYQVNERNVKLHLLDPHLILNKGYSILKHNNKVIKDYNKIKSGDKVSVRGANGEVIATINEVKIDE